MNFKEFLNEQELSEGFKQTELSIITDVLKSIPKDLLKDIKVISKKWDGSFSGEKIFADEQKEKGWIVDINFDNKIIRFIFTASNRLYFSKSKDLKGNTIEWIYSDSFNLSLKTFRKDIIEIAKLIKSISKVDVLNDLNKFFDSLNQIDVKKAENFVKGENKLIQKVTDALDNLLEYYSDNDADIKSFTQNTAFTNQRKLIFNNFKKDLTLNSISNILKI